MSGVNVPLEPELTGGNGRNSPANRAAAPSLFSRIGNGIWNAPSKGIELARRVNKVFWAVTENAKPLETIKWALISGVSSALGMGLTCFVFDFDVTVIKKIALFTGVAVSTTILVIAVAKVVMEVFQRVMKAVEPELEKKVIKSVKTAQNEKSDEFKKIIKEKVLDNEIKEQGELDHEGELETNDGSPPKGVVVNPLQRIKNDDDLDQPGTPETHQNRNCMNDSVVIVKEEDAQEDK